MIQPVNTHREGLAEATNVKIALEKMAKYLSTENIVFLASLADKPKINEKLSAKKSMIKTFL